MKSESIWFWSSTIFFSFTFSEEGESPIFSVLLIVVFFPVLVAFFFVFGASNIANISSDPFEADTTGVAVIDDVD